MGGGGGNNKYNSKRFHESSTSNFAKYITVILSRGSAMLFELKEATTPTDSVQTVG